jgi:hypothetical protein
VSVIVSNSGRIECLIIPCILQGTDDCLDREAVADGVAPGALFAFRTGFYFLMRCLWLASICRNENATTSDLIRLRPGDLLACAVEGLHCSA